jgi:hypothetical protein
MPKLVNSDLLDPLFTDSKPKNTELAFKKSAETLESQALRPPLGTKLRPLWVGAHNEKIPVMFDDETRTVYPTPAV